MGHMMMRFPFSLFTVPLFMVMIFAPPQAAQGGTVVDVTDPTVCIDGMETVPDQDDLEPILAAMDGSCMAQQTPISI